ncbi:MAG: hypothetical protein DIZ80_13195 [endosymbiont of Galathealinum brachiosum]|uniref:Uncharacterized protein n=1 Tax=endosymbiont of Galathealinum brachiosum TaxID=2200906 RepID=A0A370D828_9GAMM|nr:MAG: hypothetical protein DIZ80_13195 [endosymbiont of Galathealinum brachiosum]
MYLEVFYSGIIASNKISTLSRVNFMNFNITIDEESYTLEVKDELMQELQNVHNDMDAEFDKGIQLGRYWIDTPDLEQRCQFTANNVVSAIHQEKIRDFYLQASYILSKFPDLKRVTVSSDFEISDIDIEV